MLSQPSPMPQELKDLIYDENADEQERLAAVTAWRGGVNILQRMQQTQKRHKLFTMRTENGGSQHFNFRNSFSP